MFAPRRIVIQRFSYCGQSPNGSSPFHVQPAASRQWDLLPDRHRRVLLFVNHEILSLLVPVCMIDHRPQHTPPEGVYEGEWTKPFRGRNQAASPISRLTSGFPPSFIPVGSGILSALNPQRALTSDEVAALGSCDRLRKLMLVAGVMTDEGLGSKCPLGVGDRAIKQFPAQNGDDRALPARPCRFQKFQF
jgi:hypothetical protein